MIAGEGYGGIGVVSCGEIVELLSAVDIAIKFGHVTEVVESEGIVGIDEISLVKVPFRADVIVVGERFYAFLIERLYGSRLGSLWNFEPNVSGQGARGEEDDEQETRAG